MDKVERASWATLVIGLFFGAAIGILIGTGTGYKTGQVDYARGKVEYTIISERIVHIMGLAPLPETKLHPIKE